MYNLVCHMYVFYLIYLELEQLLSGDTRDERGERAADDDCLRNLFLLLGLPSRS